MVDMPLSRTRSLLANINSSATVSESSAYLPHISDTQHLPPLKSKLIGGPGTLFNGVGSNGVGHTSDNCDSMSINGSIVSNGSVTSIAGATNGVITTSLTNGHVNGVHVNGMATLPLVRPTTGDTSRNSTLESPKHDSNAQQNGNLGINGCFINNSLNSFSITHSFCMKASLDHNFQGSTASLKPKTMVATPEQVMKLYMNKLTPYEHHEIFNYPQIYFIGANAKKRPGIIGGPNNCGYDDEQVSQNQLILQFGIWLKFIRCIKLFCPLTLDQLYTHSESLDWVWFFLFLHYLDLGYLITRASTVSYLYSESSWIVAKWNTSHGTRSFFELRI